MKNLINIDHKDPVLRTFMLFMQMAGAVTRYADSCFYRDTGCSLSHYIALKGLQFNNGKMTHADLASWTNTQPHNITTLVRRMARDKLVTTKRDDTDKRIIYVKLATRGKEILEESAPAARRIMEQVMQGMGRNKSLQLERLLINLKRNLLQAD